MRITMPRVLLLLFMLCSMTMVFIARCGLNFDAQDEPPDHLGMRSLESVRRDNLIESFSESEKRIQQLVKEKQQFLDEIEKLQQNIANLQMQLTEARNMASDMAQKGGVDQDHRQTALYYERFFMDKMKQSEVLHGQMYNNEYELTPFCRFTLTRIYLVEPGLGKRVVEKPIGMKKKEITEVVGFAVDKLNVDRRGTTKYTQDEFLEGIYRNEPTLGTHYELYFKDLDNAKSHYRKMVLFRPYGPMQIASQDTMSTRRETVNLILPLAGRVDKFQQFMERFARVCIRVDKHVYLTVVYFGDSGLNDVKNIIGKISKSYRFKNIRLITLSEQFSRGRGLQVGAQSWTQGDVLMFLCDVDIVFSTDFLERCRLNTEKGKRVYYPMVFSLYNPNVVYSLQDMDMPPENEQLVISKDTGFWRDFGYGMTCQYRSDFLKIKGFDEDIQGWGLEDVYLYRKYVRSEMLAVRATDPGIFHLWHEKICDPKLPPDQYKSCIRSKALNEASHPQLGMLAFKDEIDVHRALNKNQNR